MPRDALREIRQQKLPRRGPQFNRLRRGINRGWEISTTWPKRNACWRKRKWTTFSHGWAYGAGCWVSRPWRETFNRLWRRRAGEEFSQPAGTLRDPPPEWNPMRIVLGALSRPMTVIVALIAIALFAVLAILRMPIDIFPRVGEPAIYVAQPYSGMDPAQMEGYLTYYF